MAYILTKKSKRKGEIIDLHYVVKSYREGGKIKRKTLLTMREASSIGEFKKELLIKESNLLASVKLFEIKANETPFPGIQRHYQELIASRKLELKELKKFRSEVENIEKEVKSSAIK